MPPPQKFQGRTDGAAGPQRPQKPSMLPFLRIFPHFSEGCVDGGVAAHQNSPLRSSLTTQISASTSLYPSKIPLETSLPPKIPLKAPFFPQCAPSKASFPPSYPETSLMPPFVSAKPLNITLTPKRPHHPQIPPTSLCSPKSAPPRPFLPHFPLRALLPPFLTPSKTLFTSHRAPKRRFPPRSAPPKASCPK